MGSNALHLAICLFAILGTAGLALACEYLRHRNEDLKAAMMAMRNGPIVASHSIPRSECVAPVHDHQVQLTQPEAEAPAVEISASKSRGPRLRHSVEGDEILGTEAVAETAGEPEVKIETKFNVVPVMQKMSTDGAMKDWLSRRAIAKMALRNGDEKQPAALTADEPAEELKLVFVNRNERGAERAAPVGIQDGATLGRMLGNCQPYSGLVICVSVRNLDERLINKVATLLLEVARPGELVCRASKDEFVLLCPNERGSDSRRRLGDISDKLWDYQLRNLSNFSVLFCWGSENAWHAKLSDALDAARDDLALSRRTPEPRTPARRQAV